MKPVEKTMIFMISIMIEFCLTSCWDERNFFINDLNVFIDIDRKENDTYRVFLYNDSVNRGDDYIDIVYGMSDMPSIQLCFPFDKDNEIYVIDIWDEVEQIKSSNYEFHLLAPERVENGEHITSEKMERLDKVYAKIDSVRDSISSVTIQLNSRLSDLFIWKAGEYKDKRIVYPVNIKE